MFLRQFSVAVVTNYHKFRGLKQYKFIKLQFCKSEFSSGKKESVDRVSSFEEL